MSTLTFIGAKLSSKIRQLFASAACSAKKANVGCWLLMKYKALIKLALSLVMLILVLRLVELKNLEDVLLSIPIWTAAVVVLGYALGQLLSSFKWWTIAKAGGIKTSYPTALKAYYIGMFVNCFGFGTVGGDVARALLLNGPGTSKATALASVLADRVHGLAVLACIGVSAVAYWGAGKLDPAFIYLLYSIPALALLGWFIAPPILMKLLPKTGRFGRLSREVLAVFPRDAKTFGLITVVSTIFHLVQISLHLVIAVGLGVYLPWSAILTTVPFVNILTSLPISWNGLGVRENAYRALLTPTYLSAEQAVAVGAIWLLAVVVSSSIGGFISVLTKDIEVVKEAEEIHIPESAANK